MQSDPSERHPSDLLAPVFVAGLCIGYSPALYHSFFGVRAALVLLALGPALVVLVRQARSDSVARAAVAFVAVAGLASALSRHPVASLWGDPNWGTGLVFVGACVAIWAWGRTLSAVAIARCRLALFGGVVINVLVAACQLLGVAPDILEIVDRPFGLTGNAVHLGALCAATVAIAPRCRRVDLAGGGAVFFAAAGVQLSGGRSALALLVLGVVAIAIRTRTVRTGLLVALLSVAGVAATSVLPGDAPSATARASAGEGSGSFQPRIEAWRAGAAAISERPILGHGPGRFRGATMPHRSLASAQLEGDARFADAHNLGIEVLVTTGVVGALLFVLWVGLAALRARGEWAIVAALLLLAHLVEPLSVSITPLLAFAFGVAAPLRPGSQHQGRSRTAAVGGAALTAIAVTAATMLLVGEFQLQRGSLDFDREALASSESLLPSTWPTAALVTTRVEGFYGAQDEDARRAAIAAARRAVNADPSDDTSWARLGTLEGVWGSPARAAEAFDEALERNPWSLAGLRGRAQVAESAGEERRAAALCRRLRQATMVGSCADRPLEDW